MERVTRMNRMEKVVGIVDAIYQARRAMKAIACGQEYAYRVEDYQESIRQAMAKHRCSALEGAMHCIRVLQEKMPDSGVAQVWILVAVADMIEPDDAQAKEQA